MRKLAEKLGIGWLFVALMPTATFASQLLKAFNVEEQASLIILIPLLLIQIFGLGIIIAYNKEVFDY